MKTIELDGVTIELVKKRVKRLTLHVTPERVWMSVPQRVSYDEAVRFALQQRAWIAAQRAQIAIRTQQSVCEGARIRVWGAYVRLALTTDGQTARMGDILTLRVRSNAGEDEVRRALDDWYRVQLAAVLPDVRARWEHVVGAKAADCRIRDMKTRWGTCSLRLRRVWINLRLAQYPPACLDYVMVHELTHLLVPNHSVAFWSLMDRFYPDWRAVRAALR